MKVIGTNRKALHDFEVLATYEAGIVLLGSEVKSLREGQFSISDAYAQIQKGEIMLMNFHIAPYRFTSGPGLDPKRPRKLLLRRDEIKKLYGVVRQRGNTLVPLKVYFSDRSLAKVTLGICRRKRQYDKKEKIIAKESERQLSRLRKTRA